MRSSVAGISPSVMLLLLLELVLLGVSAEAAITCSSVIKDLTPCVKYLQSGSGMPPVACCAGASALSSAASTTAVKQAACSCLKTAAQKLNPNAQLAKDLPSKCGITLAFTISPTVDCSTVS